MRMCDDLHHQEIGIKHSVVVWYHAPGNCEDGAKHAKIEENGAATRDFKMKKKIWVDDRREEEDSGEGSCNKGYESDVYH
jgi:hypothetical protein